MGPLKHLWPMRLEAKHPQFKKLARSAKNFRNLTFTLCMWHRLRTCYQLHSYQLYADFWTVHDDDVLVFCGARAKSGQILLTVQSKQVAWDTFPECAGEVMPTTAHQVLCATLDHHRNRYGSTLVKQNRGSKFHRPESIFIAKGKLFALTMST